MGALNSSYLFAHDFNAQHQWRRELHIRGFVTTPNGLPGLIKQERDSLYHLTNILGKISKAMGAALDDEVATVDFIQHLEWTIEQRLTHNIQDKSLMDKCLGDLDKSALWKLWTCLSETFLVVIG